MALPHRLNTYKYTAIICEIFHMMGCVHWPWDKAVPSFERFIEEATTNGILIPDINGNYYFYGDYIYYRKYDHEDGEKVQIIYGRNNIGAICIDCWEDSYNIYYASRNQVNESLDDDGLYDD